jgi:hypothetical protein
MVSKYMSYAIIENKLQVQSNGIKNMKLIKHFRFMSCLVFLLILLSVTTVCNPSRPREVTFDQLFANPGSYNSKEIVLQGYYFSGFEIQVIAEGLKSSGYAEGHLIPEGKMLWVNGGIPIDVYNQLRPQSMMGPLERYGKVRITGKFEYGGQYGHLGGYSSQITPTQVELIHWAP